MNEYYMNKFTDPDTIKRIEEKENSPEFKEKLLAIKTKMKGKKTQVFDFSFLIALVIGILLMHTRYYSLFIICFVLYLKFFKSDNKVDNDISDDYANAFMAPILEEVFPETTVNYNESLEVEDFDKIFIDSHRYESSCHTSFADPYKTQLYNLKAFYKYRNSKGNLVDSIGFLGQVLLENFDTKGEGHVRIVPLKYRNEYGPHIEAYYGKIQEGEREILTESIEFNDSYAVFATDELLAKRILDPNIIEILNAWYRRTELCLYVDEKGLMMSFNTGSYMFDLPSRKVDIDKLSLSGEYEKVRVNLAYFYGLMALIKGKL